jgi:hypothetical protein
MKGIKQVLQLLEASLYSGPVKIGLDTTKEWKSHEGHKMYGGQGDNEITYDTVTHHFSTSIHACTHMPGKEVIVQNMQTKKEIKFVLVKTDMDSTQEDIYGWNYKSTNSQIPCTMLIQND